MLAFLQNQWVVGIGCSLISTILIYLFSKFFFRRKENQRYFEQIFNANRDIIRILKPYVAEKGLPEKEVIDAIIASIARKYKVKKEELYSIRVICEDLICEIIENVYVSTDKKKEYSIQLNNYLQSLDVVKNKKLYTDDIQNEIKNTYDILNFELKRRQGSIDSVMISLMFLISMIITILVPIIENNHIPDIPDVPKSDMIMAFTIIMTFTIMIIIMLSDKFVDLFKHIEHILKKILNNKK